MSLEADVTGRVTHGWTPVGTAFTSPTGSVGAAIPYDRRYTYDDAGRLTQVNDRTAAQTGVDITATPPSCVIRVYGFDANGNRTSRPANTAGSRATSNINGSTFRISPSAPTPGTPTATPSPAATPSPVSSLMDIA